ncbi:MAG: PEP-CTERM sorting domain-containing protein [Bryobacteraceae bacterium]
MKKLIVLAISIWASVSAFASTTYTEDFEAQFPAWESGWFATNSNAQNYYGIGTDRGNNADGLWIQDDDSGNQDVRIVFNSLFAQALNDLSFDVAGYSEGTRLEFFDANNNVLSDVLVTLTNGAFFDPGTYVNYAVNSATGIGGFRFYGANVAGNTSIDNIVANAGTGVPEPSSVALVLGGAAFLAFRARRKSDRPLRSDR